MNGPIYGKRGKEGKTHIDIWDCLKCDRSPIHASHHVVFNTKRGPKRHGVKSPFRTKTICDLPLDHWEHMKSYP